MSIDPYELQRIKDILKECGYTEYPIIIPGEKIVVDDGDS